MFKPINVLRSLERVNSAQRVVPLLNQKTFIPGKCGLCSNQAPVTGKAKRESREILFINPTVQSILKSITGYEFAKVFSNKPVGKYKPPMYLFLTDEELEKTRQRAIDEGEKKLDMPPVMEPREEKIDVLESVPEWQGFDYCNLVFTDVSSGFTDRTRLIAVREPNGTLRRAKWDERYRMNQLYFPVPGRSYDEPKMFQDKNYEDVLDRHDYEFFLDRACIQYEPDDPKFIFFTTKCYEHINQTQKFDILRSTRHFGPLAFHLAYEGNIDLLLIDMIEKNLLQDASQLIQLYYLIHSKDNKSLNLPKSDYLSIVKHFLQKDCKRRQLLDLALKDYLDSLKNKAQQDNDSGDDLFAASHG